MTPPRHRAPTRPETRRRRVGLALTLAAALLLGGTGPAAAGPLTEARAWVAPASAVTAAPAALPAAAPAAVPAAAKTKGHRVSLTLSDAKPRRGESLWITGRLLRIDYPVRGAVVAIERRAAGSSTWKKVRKAKTNASGRFSVRERATGSASYRARVDVAGVTVRSTRKAVKVANVRRTMTSRVAALGSRLGTSKASAVRLRVKGTGTVVYRNYSKGMLVRSGSGKAMRTWFVNGPMRATYLKNGGPTGRLGVPLADARCGLVESGCVQRFKGGAIYDNKNVKPTVFLGTSKAVEVLAAAKSQAGYTQKTHNRSRYNSWIGSTNAWCSFYQSWAFAAAGHKSLIPQSKKFTSFVKSARSSLKTGSKPKVGALVFFDTITDGSVSATHVGIVAKVNKSTITTYEGNTSNPKNSSQRGAYLKTRSLSQPLYYAYPEYP